MLMAMQEGPAAVDSELGAAREGSQTLGTRVALQDAVQKQQGVMLTSPVDPTFIVKLEERFPKVPWMR